MSIITGTKQQLQGALDRARVHGGASRVMDLGNNRYSVLSSDNRTFYKVVIVAHSWLCSCQAGQNGRVCYHLGCVYLYNLGRQMGAARRAKEVAA